MHIADPLERRLNKRGTNMVIPWNPNMAKREDMRLINTEEAKRLVKEGKQEAVMRREVRMQEMIAESQVANIHSKPGQQQSPVEIMPVEASPPSVQLAKNSDAKPLHKMTKSELFNELRQEFSYEPMEDSKIMDLRKVADSFRKTGKPPETKEKVVV